MKKELLRKSLSVILAGSIMLSAISCKNDDDDSSSSGSGSPSSPNVTNNFVEDKEDVAFTLLSQLCNLYQYSPENSITDDNETIIGGSETLPDGWESMQFEPDFGGHVLDEENNPTVWSIGFLDYTQAAEWFFDLIGKMPETDEDSYPDAYKYTSDVYSGVLAFKKSSEENLYATIDVSIPQLSKVTQIRCVPQSVIANALPENASTLQGYYGAGSIITDTNTGITWMCVRPSGGPNKKDKSYWISLSSENNFGDSIFKPETKSVSAQYNVMDQDELVDVENAQWTYAKDVMSFKTAKAAYHTFSLLAMGWAQGGGKFESIGDENAGKIEYPTDYILKFDGVDKWTTRYKELKSNGVDIMALNAYTEGKKPTATPYNLVGSEFWYTESHTKFVFAYGSPQNDKYRAMTTRNGENLAACAYIQPMFVGVTRKGKNGKLEQNISTKVYRDNVSGTNLKKIFVPYSVTDMFDEKTVDILYDLIGAVDYIWGNDLSVKLAKKKVAWDKDKWVYDFRNYATYFTTSSLASDRLYLKNSDKYYAKWFSINASSRYNVIFAKEWSFTDKSSAKDPLNSNRYKIIVRIPQDTTAGWWNTLNKIERVVDYKTVKWADEMAN